MSNILNISYVINERNEIVFVNEDWSELAIANAAPELVAENILNRNLWDFISGDTTREVYKNLVEKVRAGRAVNFDLRCDSPDQRRFTEMSITLQENKHIRFDSRVVNAEKRVVQNVFQSDERRSDKVIVVCSWCKKVDMRDGTWREIEEALSNLELFESDNIPKMSHGMCISCYRAISKKHQDTFKDNPA